jgi:predicted enzyme related to lactoylglutathione lyase
MVLFTEHAAGKPCWVDVNVETSEEREALMAFYSALFGWTFEVGTPETGFYSRALHKGQPVMGIGQGPGGAGHLVTYFSTPDLDFTLQLVWAQGGQLVMGPMQIMDFGSMALVMDSTGAMHGLWQPDKFAGFGVMYEPNSPGWFDHVSEDTAAAAAYYVKILANGVELHSESDMQILKHADEWFASLTKEDCSVIPPHWNPIFVVDSLDRIKGDVKKLGGKIIVEEMPVPGSTISVFQEPVKGTYVTVMEEISEPVSAD